MNRVDSTAVCVRNRMHGLWLASTALVGIRVLPQPVEGAPHDASSRLRTRMARLLALAVEPTASLLDRLGGLLPKRAKKVRPAARSGRRRRWREAVLAAALTAAAPAAQAQTATWNGANSDYNAGANWTPNAAPVAAGQDAVFGAAGSTAVAVTAGPIAPNAWTFNAAAQSYTITGAGVNFGGAGLINNAASGTISIANVIGGVGGVRQNGAGTLVLTGANTYSGGTTISGGTLDVTNAASLGTGDVTVNGGTLRATSNVNLGNRIFTQAGGTATFSAAPNTTLSANFKSGLLDGNVSFGTTTDTGTVIYISGGGVTSSGNALTLNGGTLRDDSGGGLGSAAGFISVTRVNAGTLDFADRATTISNLQGAGGTVTTGTGALTVNGGTYAGTIGTVASLTKATTGTLVLTGANTYSGGTTVAAGVLNIQNATALGTTAGGTTVASGATLQLQGGISVLGEALTLSGSGSNATTPNGALQNVSGVNTFGGTVTLAAASRINADAGTLQLTAGNTVTGAFGLTLGGAGNGLITGTIATGANTLTKDGTGIWRLNNASTYSGGTSINAGTLIANNNAALGTGSVAVATGGTLGLQGSITVANALVLAGSGGAGTGTNNGALNSLNGTNTYTGAITLAAASRINTNAGTLALSGGIGGAGQNLTFGGAGATTVSGAIATGAGTVTKDGAGTLTLSGANTYSGITTIDAGTLAVTGGNALANTGTVALTAGGGGTFAVRTSETIGALSGGAAVANAGAGTVAITAGQTLTTGGANLSTTYSGAINGAGALVVAGLTNTATFAGALTQTGGFTLADASNVTIAATGSYVANVAGDGIVLNGGTFTNQGTITVTGTQGTNAILTGRSVDTTVVNAAGARIEAQGSGVLQIFNSSAPGALTVDNAGSIQGNNYDGVTQHGTGALSVTNSGVIYGRNAIGSSNGYGVGSDGTGVLTLTNAAGGTIVGQYGVVGSNAADTVTNAGTIASGTYTAGAATPITRGGLAGIQLRAGGTVINQATGRIESAGQGVVSNAGSLSVTNAGAIDSTRESGIFNANGVLSVSNTGTIAGQNGIDANLASAANITVTGNGTLTGRAGFGVRAVSGTGDVVLGTTAAALGTVSGTSNAIRAATGGAGTVSVVAGAGVRSTGGDAISVSTAGTGAASVTLSGSNAAVQGGTPGGAKGAGVRVVTNTGAGTINVTGANNTVTGDQPAMIAQTANANAAIAITGTGNTFTGSSGLIADQRGTGAFASTVSVANGNTVAFNTADATDAYNGQGIFAGNRGTGATSITTGTGSVTGNANGVLLLQTNVGNASAVTITTGGDVTGLGGASSLPGIYPTPFTGVGIGASNAGTGTLTVTASGGTIQAPTNGIDARATGSGAIVVNQSGGQIGTSAAAPASVGLNAERNAAGTISVTAGTVFSGDEGVRVINFAAGDVTVATQGNITAGSLAVNASLFNRDGSGTGNVAVTTAAGTTLSGGSTGDNRVVNATHVAAGTGYVQVTNNATITRPVGVSRGTAIFTSNGTSGLLDTVQTAIAVTNAGTITNAFVTGIFATASGGGAVSVANSGTIAAGTTGILATSSGTGAVTAGGSGGVAGGTTGITATQTGAGPGAGITAVAVSGTGPTTGTAGIGIDARVTSATNAGNVLVTRSGLVTAGTAGINAATTGTGTVTVSAGPITTANGSGIVAVGTSGAVAVTANGAIVAGGAGNAGLFLIGNNANNTATVASAATVQGAIGLRVTGTGTTTLANSGTIATTGGTGANALQIEAGTLVIGNTAGTLTGNLAVVNAASTLTVNRTADLTLANTVTGAGVLNQNGTGTTTLAGVNGAANGQFTGTANVNAGTLAVNGVFGDTAGNAATVTINAGGTLHGTGTIAGSVVVTNGGTVSAGNSPGTLTVAGNHTLTAGSTSLFELGAPGVVGGASNDLINVGGNLTLGGTLQLVSATDATRSPVSGAYRLYSYNGTLAGGFGTVTTPSASTSALVYTNIPNQVNVLLANGGQSVQYWDGTDTIGATAGAQGGTATWNTTNTNWTLLPGGQVNDVWRSGVGIFGGTAGTVTVAGAQNVQGLQFITTGYALGGTGTLNLTGDPSTTPTQSFVNVDANVGATLANALTSTGGAIGLRKIGAGALTLTGASTYTGATTVEAGTLTLAAGASLTSSVTNNAGATFANGGALNGNLSNAGTASNSGTVAGFVTNGGTFTNSGTVAGLVTNTAGLTTNTGTFNGGATVTGGTLALDAGSIVNGTVSNSATVTAQGQINGPLTNNPGASFTLTGALTVLTGVTNNGTLTLAGNGLGVGTLGGNGTTQNASATAATLTVGAGAGGDSAYGGLLQDGAGGGALGLTKTGTGTLTLTGTNTYTGATTIAAGSGLQIGTGGTLGSIAGTSGVAANGTLTFNRSDAIAFAPAISGAGLVNQNGSGALTLTGISTAFTGTANVNAGTLTVNGTLGNLAAVGLIPANSAVINVNSGGTLQGTGTIAGSVVVNGGATVSAGSAAPGTLPGTLTVGGNYTVNAGSNNVFQLGTPNVVGGATNDLIGVGGTLVINGGTASLQNANASGLYRLYNVGGAITPAAGPNLGFTSVTATNGTASIYAVQPVAGGPNQVNARVSLGGQVVQYWDGTDVSGLAGGTPGARGGSGIWNATNANWTDDPAAGQVNQNWQSQFGVFTAPTAGGASTVTVVGPQNLQGLQFAGDGYTLTPGAGGSLNLTGDPNGLAGFSTIRVDAGFSATIAAPITGAGLNKAVGSGTLVLTGANSFNALTIADGTVDVRGGAAIADTAPVTLANVAGARLLVTNSETIGSLAGGGTTGGTVAILAGQTLTTGANNASTSFGGSIGGAGGLIKTGSGTFTLSGANTFGGGTTVASGTLVNTGSLASGVGVNAAAVFVNNGTLAAGLTNAGSATNTGGIGGGVTNTGTFTNNAGATVDNGLANNAGTASNAGTINGGAINAAAFGNTASGAVNGGLTNNAGTATNAGTINNGATVAAGSTLTSTGIVNGGLTNSGTVNAQGQANGPVTNTAGARLTVTGGLTGIGRLTNNGAVDLGGNTLTVGSLAGTVAAATIGNGGGLTTGGDGTSSTYAGGITGANTALTKTGAGTLTLSGNNTYGGATTIQGGTLAVAGTGIVNGTRQIQNSAGFTIAAGGQVTTPQFTNTATGTVTTAGTLNATTAIANAGSFTLSGGSVTTAALSNTGTLAQSGGTLTAQAFGNAAGASFAQTAGTLATDTLTNGGGFTSAGTVTATTAIANTGSLSVNGGTVSTGAFTNAGSYSQAAGASLTTRTVDNSGSFTAAGPVAATNRFSNTGTLAASGTITTPTFVNAGTVNGGLTLAGVSQITNLSGALIRDGVSISTAAGGAVLDNAGTIGSGGLVLNTASGGLTANNTSGRTFFGYVSSAAGTLSTYNNTATGAWRYQGIGALAGTDTINNAGLFEVTAAGGALNGLERFNNLAGGQVTLNGALAGPIATIDNAGTINLNGNALTGVGSLLNRNSLVMAGGTLGTGTLSNSGTLAASGVINTATFDNGGTVNLAGNLGGSTGTLNNTGLINLVTSSSFTGIGTLNNAGVIGNRGGNGFNGTFGVNTFNNGATGQINLQNNSTGDSLTLTGNYVGSAGSRLAIDVDLSRSDAGLRADILRIGGANNGQSLLTLNPVNGGRVFFATPIPVVQTAGGGAGQLQVDPATPLQANGFITYSLQQTPGSAGSYQIVSRIEPSQAATSVAGITGMITSLNVGFFQSINAFISGPAEHKICTDVLREAKLCEQQAPASVGVTTSDKSWTALNRQAATAPVAADLNESGILPNTLGFGLWGRGSGGETTIRSESTAETGAGGTLTGQNRTRISFAGFQFGGDVAAFNIDNSGFNLHVGVTGGEVYATGRELLSSQASGQFSVPFVGAYAAVTSGPFTSDISFRHDFYNARISDPVSGVQNRALPIGSDTWGASAGYRFDLPNLLGGEQAFFVEPSGSISYTQTRVGTLPVTGGFLNFDRIDSILGRVGFRVGTTFVAGDRLALQPFATASVWNEFADNALSRFLPTASAALLQQGQSAFFVPILTNRVGTFGQVGVGVTGQLLGTDLLGYVRGDLRFGERIDGYSINGGVRYPF